ncbi:MAG: hypothetical protein HY724_05170 [Candidatus Rokubacteria bacterium]|nr:hypothetical protein [Candidatus Rokubacteria bacterium]
MRRVVVTGLGVVTAMGTGRGTLWQALSAGGPVGLSAVEARSDGIEPDIRRSRTMGRIARFSVLASQLALEDGRIEPGAFRSEDLGVFLGTNLDDINLLALCRAFSAAGVDPATGEPDLTRFVRVALETLHPFDYLRALSNMPASHVAIRWQARGVNCSYVSHGISGVEAIGEAYLAVRDGIVECALAGASDSWLTPFGLWRREILGGASLAPMASVRGSGTRPGLGEGAAVLLLEPLEAARARGAGIYGEVSGYAKALDAERFPNLCRGAGLARSIRWTLARSGLSPAEVDYLSSHGEGSVEADGIEARALREVFGSNGLPPMRALKRATGHLGAASGALEAAATLLVISRQWLPPSPSTAELPPAGSAKKQDAPERRAQIRAALNIAFHPMGLSASLAFRQLPDRDWHGQAGP